MGSVLGASAKVFGAANLLGFGISCATGSHLHLDLIGTGAFAAAAAFTRITDLRSKLSTAAVGLWATRLASFLLFRATQLGHDVRLDGTLSTVGGAFAFWAVSFVWGWLTALPHTLGAASARRPQLGKGGLLGAVLVVWGLLWEAGADWQKWAFKQDPANGGRFCDVGLWALSQHPNYFGNLCIWSGIFLLNLAPLASVFLKPGDLGPEARGRSVLRSLAGVLLGSLSFVIVAIILQYVMMINDEDEDEDDDDRITVVIAIMIMIRGPSAHSSSQPSSTGRRRAPSRTPWRWRRRRTARTRPTARTSSRSPSSCRTSSSSSRAEAVVGGSSSPRGGLYTKGGEPVCAGKEGRKDSTKPSEAGRPRSGAIGCPGAGRCVRAIRRKLLRPAFPTLWENTPPPPDCLQLCCHTG